MFFYYVLHREICFVTSYLFSEDETLIKGVLPLKENFGSYQSPNCPILIIGNNICDFLFSSWTMTPFQKGVNFWTKEFAPK